MSATSAAQPLLVDARTAASMLAVSTRTLATLVAEEKLPAIRVRRCLRFDVKDLEA